MGIEKSLEKIKECAEDIINEAAKKAKLDTNDFDLAGKAIKMLHHIDQMHNADLMMSEAGYSGNSYRRVPYLHEMSYMRGRDPATGRYMSRDVDPAMSWSPASSYDDNNNNNRYSGHTNREAKMDVLNDMLANAQSESERQLIQKWLRRIDQIY